MDTCAFFVKKKETNRDKDDGCMSWYLQGGAAGKASTGPEPDRVRT